MQRPTASGKLARVAHFESSFDGFRPLVRARWRESAEPGAGLWFDLDPHLLDQLLQLFGWPQALCVDAATRRDDALSDDWCMATLHCDRLRVTLHASMLQAAFNPRYAVHGTRGSYVELGLDRQEDALKAGRRPAWPAPADRGIDTGGSTLQVPRGDAISVDPWPLARG